MTTETENAASGLGYVAQRDDSDDPFIKIEGTASIHVEHDKEKKVVTSTIRYPFEFVRRSVLNRAKKLFGRDEDACFAVLRAMQAQYNLRRWLDGQMLPANQIINPKLLDDMQLCMRELESEIAQLEAAASTTERDGGDEELKAATAPLEAQTKRMMLAKMERMANSLLAEDLISNQDAKTIPAVMAILDDIKAVCELEPTAANFASRVFATEASLAIANNDAVRTKIKNALTALKQKIR